jgi:hypothetical protein
MLNLIRVSQINLFTQGSYHTGMEIKRYTEGGAKQNHVESSDFCSLTGLHFVKNWQLPALCLLVFGKHGKRIQPTADSYRTGA